MLAPAIMFARAPLPIVVMDADVPRRAIGVAFRGVPAITASVANNSRRSRRRQRDHTGRGGNSAQSESSDLHSDLHRTKVNRPSGQKNGGTQACVPPSASA